MGTSEEELKHIVYDLGVGPYFLGIYDKHFPGFLNKHSNACAIVNTASRETGGVHWIAMAWHPPSNFYLFDPFGFSDKKLLQIYQFEYNALLKRSAITSSPDRCVQLYQNNESVQSPNSAACGLYCCMFLHAFANWPAHPFDNPTMDQLVGVPNNMLEAPQAQSIFKQNQETLYSFLHYNSSFFRRYENKLRKQTDP